MMARTALDLDELDDVVDDLAPAAGIVCALGLSLHFWDAIAHLVMWLQ
jgi:hypothetical protein